MFVTWLEGAEVDAGLKTEMHNVYLQMTGGQKHPFLFEAESSVWFTKDARDIASTLEPSQPFLAVAMVARSLAFRLLCDFYQRFYKPMHPYKVFRDREKAIEWLKTF